MPSLLPGLALLAAALLPGVAGSQGRPAGAAPQMVVTATRAPTFAAAAAAPITSVKDGDPAFLAIRLPQPLKAFAFPRRDDDTMVGAYDRLMIHVGPRGKADEVYETCVLTLLPDEAAKSEIVLSIAPGDGRPGLTGMGCWMKVVGSGKAGTWNNELRLIGTKPGTGERSTVLAVAPLTAAVAGGIGKTKALYEAAVTRFEKGDPMYNPLPPEQVSTDKKLASALPGRAAEKTKRKPTTSYVTDDDWMEDNDALGRPYQEHTSGAAIFRSAPCGWQPLEVVRKPGGSSIVRINVDASFTEVACSRMPKK